MEGSVDDACITGQRGDGGPATPAGCSGPLLLLLYQVLVVGVVLSEAVCEPQQALLVRMVVNTCGHAAAIDNTKQQPGGAIRSRKTTSSNKDNRGFPGTKTTGASPVVSHAGEIVGSISQVREEGCGSSRELMTKPTELCVVAHAEF